MGMAAGEPVPAGDEARRAAILRHGMAAGRAGAWEWDAGTQLLCCTATMSRLFGLTSEEGLAGVTLDRLLSVVHEADLNDMVDAVREARAEGGLFAREYRTCPIPGVTYAVQAQGYYHRDARGVVVRGAGVILDVSEAICQPEPTDPFTRLMYALAEAKAAVDVMPPSAHALLAPPVHEAVHRFGRLARHVDKGGATEP